MGIKKEESSWEKPADSRKQKRKRRKRRSKGLVEEAEGKTKFKEVSLKRYRPVLRVRLSTVSLLC